MLESQILRILKAPTLSQFPTTQNPEVCSESLKEETQTMPLAKSPATASEELA